MKFIIIIIFFNNFSRIFSLSPFRARFLRQIFLHLLSLLFSTYFPFFFSCLRSALSSYTTATIIFPMHSVPMHTKIKSFLLKKFPEWLIAKQILDGVVKRLQQFFFFDPVRKENKTCRMTYLMAGENKFLNGQATIGWPLIVNQNIAIRI